MQPAAKKHAENTKETALSWMDGKMVIAIKAIVMPLHVKWGLNWEQIHNTTNSFVTTQQVVVDMLIIFTKVTPVHYKPQRVITSAVKC